MKVILASRDGAGGDGDSSSYSLVSDRTLDGEQAHKGDDVLEEMSLADCHPCQTLVFDVHDVHMKVI